MTGSTLVASNPDAGRGEKNPAMFAMGPIGGRHDGPGPAGVVSPGTAQPRPTSGPVDETQLVDRIAHRLADIMTERVGVGSDAPPSYVGEDGEFYASPPPPPPQAAAQETSPSPAGSSSYPPSRSATSTTKPPTSPQYVQSPPSASASGPQLQPPTPPASSTSFGASAAGRFGPRPRPAGSVSGRPGEYGAQPPTAQRRMSASKELPTSPRGASWRAEGSSPPS